MKPLFILMTFISSLFISKAHAGDVSGDVLKSFQSTFAQAKEVSWTVTENLYKAEFTLNDQAVTAFYNNEGQFLGLTRNITSFQLPLMLQATIKKEYKDYWISELFELSNDNGTEYYITLENADTKITLKSSNMSWTSYRKQNK
jgi:hypothetical protein